MREEFKPAIEALQKDLSDLERQVSETKQVINRLCSRAGMEPLYPEATQQATSTIASVRPDSFYGKPITTAAREFLEMRRNASLGPATPREIYEALSKGGYTFETKDETTAIISVRGTIRKNSSIFHRLPNGTYGLLSWYPNARPQRDEDEEEAKPSRAAKSRHASARKPAAKAKSNGAGHASQRKSNSPEDSGSKAERIRQELKAFLAAGPKTRVEILDRLKAMNLMGYEKNPVANLSAYLSRWRDLVTRGDDEKWRLAPQTNEPPGNQPSGS